MSREIIEGTPEQQRQFDAAQAHRRFWDDIHNKPTPEYLYRRATTDIDPLLD